MKIALLSESSADEAAVLILIEGLLGRRVQRVDYPAPRTRGWMGVDKAIEPTLRHLHYRTDAEALVVVIDSDESPIHRKEHAGAGSCDPKCRLCLLREKIIGIQGKLRPRQGQGPIVTGLGIAVPAIEAWVLFDADAHISESTWIQALQSHNFPFTKKDLKQRIYGSNDPSLVFETKRLTENASRLVKEDKLSVLEIHFPVGFGSLAEEVRNWRS